MNSIKIVILLFILITLMGCGGNRVIDRTTVLYDLNTRVVMYDDVRALRDVHRGKGGYKKGVKGFWDKRNNTIHTVKDMYVLGHEYFHVLGLIEDYE